MTLRPRPDVLDEIEKARNFFREGSADPGDPDTLPMWFDNEWITAIATRLGQAAVSAGQLRGLGVLENVGIDEADSLRREFRGHLIVLAAITFDAIEDTDRRLFANEDTPQAERMVEERKNTIGVLARIMLADGFARDEIMHAVEAGLEMPERPENPG